MSFKTMPFRPAASRVGRAERVRSVDTGAPAGIKLGAGAAAVVTAVVVAAALPKPSQAGRLAIVAGTTGLFGAVALDLASLVGVTVIAWLLVNGFLVNQLGVLTWHGPADLGRLGVLAGAAAVGLAVGGLRRGRRVRAERLRFDAATRDLRHEP